MFTNRRFTTFAATAIGTAAVGLAIATSGSAAASPVHDNLTTLTTPMTAAGITQVHAAGNPYCNNRPGCRGMYCCPHW